MSGGSRVTRSTRPEVCPRPPTTPRWAVAAALPRPQARSGDPLFLQHDFGSLAMFAAMRRASSRVMRCAAGRRPPRPRNRSSRTRSRWRSGRCSNPCPASCSIVERPGPREAARGGYPTPMTAAAVVKSKPLKKPCCNANTCGPSL
jgi:hypothetical protein